MLTDQIRKQNATVAVAAIDLVCQTMQKMEGGYLGKIDMESVAQIAAVEYNQELINRREHNA